MAFLHALTPRPPLGWNSFDSYGVYASEETMRANLDAMAEKLKPAGYQFFTIDAGWYGEYTLIPGTRYAAEPHASDVNLDAWGRCEPSHCYFPNGFQSLIDRCHGLGLKFGLHIMRGIPRKAVDLNLPIHDSHYRAADVADRAATCSWCHYNYGVDMTRLGAQDWYDSVVRKLAEWGVDFIKADDITGFPAEIEAMVKAISRSGRPIVLSLSPGGKGGPVTRANLPVYRTANMLRITGDVWDDRYSLQVGFDAWHEYENDAGDGFWPDLDMIPFGQLQLMSPPREATAALSGKGTCRWCRLSRPQAYSFITQRALAASPLIVGGDLPTLDELSLGLLTHPGMLECNQNGAVGRRMYAGNGVDVWKAPRRNDRHEGWVGVFNRDESEPRTLELSADLLGVPATSRLHNVWDGRFVGDLTDILKITVDPDDVAFLKYTPIR